MLAIPLPVLLEAGASVLATKLPVPRKGGRGRVDGYLGLPCRPPSSLPGEIRKLLALRRGEVNQEGPSNLGLAV